VSQKFIEKHLKVSKSSYEKGFEFELRASLLHQKKERLPVLIYPNLLRERGFGQIDLAWIENHTLFVCECKSGACEITNRQLSRLIKSGLFLGDLFEKKVVLVKITSFAKKENGHYPLKVRVIKELR